MENELNSVELNTALKKYLKANKGMLTFLLDGKPITPEKFVPEAALGQFSRGDYGEPFNYAINNGNCILANQQCESPNHKFSCSIQVKFVEKKDDRSDNSGNVVKEAKNKKSSKPIDDSEYDVICVQIKNNTIYLKNILH